jgi:competence protein ComEA
MADWRHSRRTDFGNDCFLKEEDMTFRRIVTTALAVAIATLVTAGSSFAAPAKAAPAGKVNLNTATVEQLTTVPGVGPKLAARIVEQRQKSGSFKSVQDILAVKGIGEKNLVKLQTYFTVGDSGHAAANR